uniref:BTB domain-containing protein n=1 Tax=Strongyloides papillosus TaxID=174720 RepID=A0A0N5CG82_STREA
MAPLIHSTPCFSPLRSPVSDYSYDYSSDSECAHSNYSNPVRFELFSLCELVHDPVYASNLLRYVKYLYRNRMSIESKLLLMKLGIFKEADVLTGCKYVSHCSLTYFRKFNLFYVDCTYFEKFLLAGNLDASDISVCICFNESIESSSDFAALYEKYWSFRNCSTVRLYMVGADASVEFPSTFVPSWIH